jgi:hypothetical protein
VAVPALPWAVAKVSAAVAAKDLPPVQAIAPAGAWRPAAALAKLQSWPLALVQVWRLAPPQPV